MEGDFMDECCGDCSSCGLPDCVGSDSKGYISVDTDGYVDVDRIARDIDYNEMGVDTGLYGSYGHN